MLASMTVLRLCITVILPLLAHASITRGPLDCTTRLTSLNNHGGAGSTSNMNRIASMGRMAVVSSDPTGNEGSYSCITVDFDRTAASYSLTYKDGNGADQSATGVLGEFRFVVPIVNTGYSHFTMTGLPSGVFNGGGLSIMYAGQNEFQLEACTPSIIPPQSTWTYYTLVPLNKAIVNGACGCDDWSAI